MFPRKGLRENLLWDPGVHLAAAEPFTLREEQLYRKVSKAVEEEFHLLV
jgi:hypothetical protein